MSATLPKMKIKAYALVRDCNGVPRIDDPHNLPEEIKIGITDDDLKLLPRETVEALGMLGRLET